MEGTAHCSESTLQLDEPKNLFVDIRNLGLRKGGELTHNALEDAVQQAKEFVEVLNRNNIQGVPSGQEKS